NVITGNGFTNFLYGLGGNDTIDGGAGNDRLFGGAGADSINGNVGDDSFFLSAPGDLEAGDRFDGGADGDDALRYIGTAPASLVLTAAMLKHIETVTLIGTDGNFNDADVDIDASAVASTGTMIEFLPGGATVEVQMGLTIVGNDGDNRFVGTAFQDSIWGGF